MINESSIIPISARVHRIVESQEKVATMKIVDTFYEQDLLESLIEETKPHVDHLPKRHYLIRTPFRYPPLKYGSRFGGRYEPSIFYAGATLDSALCESAFYSFYFMSRQAIPFPGTIINHKTSFSVDIRSMKHIDLTQISDVNFQNQITNKTDYDYAQKIGRKMRDLTVDSFNYTSARCINLINYGVFNINSVQGDPLEMKQWEIKQTPDEALFLCPAEPDLKAYFNISDFMVDGFLPHPSQ